MKYIILLFTLLIFSSATVEKSIRTKKDSSDININQVDRKVHFVENSFSTEIIQQYKDLNNLYSVGFSVLIALFGAIFPLLFYFFQFKPAHEALKEAKKLLVEMDEKFEKSFEQHHKKKVSKIIDDAIESYEDFEEHYLSTSYNNLDTYKSESFSINQIKRLIYLLKRNESELSNKHHFARILTFQKADVIENYFVELLSNEPSSEICIWGAIYFANNKKTEYLDLITDVILVNHNFNSIIIQLSQHSILYTYELLNNKKLIENLDENELKYFCEGIIRNEFKNLKLERFKNSDLWKKYNLIVP